MSLSSEIRARLFADLVARGSAELTCAGRSMEPTIPLGTRVRILPATDYRLGDVVVFPSTDGTLVLHRLVARAPATGWWVHTGDGSRQSQFGVVHRCELIGRAAVANRAPSLGTRARAYKRLITAGLRHMRSVLRHL